MNRASAIHPDIVGLTRWLFFISLMVYVCGPLLQQGQPVNRTEVFKPITGPTGPNPIEQHKSPAPVQQSSLARMYAAGVDFVYPLIPRGVRETYLDLNFSDQLDYPADRSKSAATASGQAPEHEFLSLIQQAAKRYDVDPALVKAIIMAESSYNPKAISRRGAKGLMQLMPGTARSLGVEDVFNPEHNIDGGVRYFKRLLKRFNGDVKLAVAAYNAGSRHVKKYKGIPPFKETRAYVKKVFKYHQYYKEMMEMG